MFELLKEMVVEFWQVFVLIGVVGFDWIGEDIAHRNEKPQLAQLIRIIMYVVVWVVVLNLCWELIKPLIEIANL